MAGEQEPPIKKFPSVFTNGEPEDLEEAAKDLQTLHAHIQEMIHMIPGDAHEFNLSHLNSPADESADPNSTG